MFTGLHAFPLTPLHGDALDERAYSGLIDRLREAGVDSITALGSTGSYMYLDREERRRTAGLAVEHAEDIPVMVGVGAVRTSLVQAQAEDAQEAGARALLLAPVTYQALMEHEVYTLFETLSASTSVPIVVYDNPATTHVTFTDDLYAGIAALPNVASLKIPPLLGNAADATERVAAIRERIPAAVTLGISGDASAVTGLLAGCNAWYSAMAGTLPATALTLARSALNGEAATALALSARLQPLWDLFAQHGSYRVIAAIAEQLALVRPDCLPRPVLGLDAATRRHLADVLENLDLHD